MSPAAELYAFGQRIVQCKEVSQPASSWIVRGVPGYSRLFPVTWGGQFLLRFHAFSSFPGCSRVWFCIGITQFVCFRYLHAWEWRNLLIGIVGFVAFMFYFSGVFPAIPGLLLGLLLACPLLLWPSSQ